MSKHTPGPWGIIIGDAGPIVFSGQKSNMVAHCIKAWSSEERMANARLIAAAPDFYAMAEMVLAWWDKHKDDTTDYVGDCDVFMSEPAFVTAARAAIAKATGETK